MVIYDYIILIKNILIQKITFELLFVVVVVFVLSLSVFGFWLFVCRGVSDLLTL